MSLTGLLTDRAREFGQVLVDQLNLDITAHSGSGLEGHARTLVDGTPYLEMLPSTDVVTAKSLRFSVHQDGELAVTAPVVEL